MTASIILPVYKQAATIARDLAEYIRAVSEVVTEFELIVVVNGGDVASRDACRSLAASEPSVRVVFLEEAGWGRAVRAGLREATGDLVCYTNSARTSAAVLKTLIQYAADDRHAVHMAMRKIREGFTRRAASLLYNLECRSLFDLNIWDVNGTPKVFPRQFERLMALSRDDDLIDLEFNLMCQRHGYPVIQVPVASASRRVGRSTTNWRSAVRLYWGAYRMWRDGAQASAP